MFKKLWKWIEKLFSKLDKKVEQAIPLATGIVEGVKKVIENPTTATVLEVIKFTIPGNTDDKIIDKTMEAAKVWVPRVALQLGIIKSIVDIEDVNEQMIAVVEALKEANKEDRSDYWHELAAFVLKQLADGKLTLGEAGSIVEYHYQNYIKK